MPVVSVLLDANVLVPLSIRDTLLRAVEYGVFDVHWTEQILEETRRTLVSKRFMTPTKAIELLDAIRDAFPKASIVGYESEIAQMTNDLDDRHVAAAAWHAHVDAMVTFNSSPLPARAANPIWFARASSRCVSLGMPRDIPQCDDGNYSAASARADETCPDRRADCG